MNLLNNVDQFDTLKKFFNLNNKVLSCPVVSTTLGRDHIYCVLQISDPCPTGGRSPDNSPSNTHKKVGRLFQSKDELILQIIAKTLGLCIEVSEYVEKVNQAKIQHKDFTRAGNFKNIDV